MRGLVIGIAVAIAGFALKDHYQPTYDLCNTLLGQASQFLNSDASNQCSIASVAVEGFPYIVGTGGIICLLGLVEIASPSRRRRPQVRVPIRQDAMRQAPPVQAPVRQRPEAANRPLYGAPTASRDIPVDPRDAWWTPSGDKPTSWPAPTVNPDGQPW
jgi:hypothetical protein